MRHDRSSARSTWALATLIAVAGAAPSQGATQPALRVQTLPGPLVELHADPFDNIYRVPPPPAAARPRTGILSSTMVVNYIGTWSVPAQVAFQHAVDIWGTLVTSPVTIEIDAHWTSLGPSLLGAAGPNTVSANFAGAPQTNTLYPAALANKLHGSDLVPGSVDIVANFNSDFTNWYFGLDGNTPSGQYDFETVVLHELTHGLGFVGSMQVGGPCGAGLGCWGNGLPFPIIFDRFTENGSNQSLLSFVSPSAALAFQLTGGDLYWDSPVPRCYNGGPAKLYAPATWAPSASYSHLDEVFNSTVNALMTYSLGTGESLHSPGPVALGILDDMGWANPIASIAGLTSIDIWESTSVTPTMFTFLPNSAALLTRLSGTLGSGNRDFEGVANSEFYDLYYSDIDGTPNSSGSYLTIECRFDFPAPSGGGLNIAAVRLNTGVGVWANSVCSYAYLGNNYIAGSEVLALGYNLSDDTTMGSTTNGNPARLRITLGFPLSSSSQGIYVAPAVGPFALLLLGLGMVTAGCLRLRRAARVA